VTAIELLRAIGNVDDHHILLSLEDVKKDIKHRACVKWTSLIMCAVIVLTAGVGLYHHHAVLPADGDMFTSPSTQRSTIPSVKEEWTLKYPDENAVCKPPLDGACMIVRYYTMQDMAKKSNLIVTADVQDFHFATEKNGKFEERYVFTELTVTEVLKGSAAVGQTLYVRDCVQTYVDSACIDSVGSYTESGIYGVGPKMENGNRVLLFLTAYQDPKSADNGVPITHSITFGTEGKFFFDRDGLYRCTTEYVDKYLSGVYVPDHKVVTIQTVREVINEG